MNFLMNYMFNVVVSSLILMMMVLISMSFFTLMERKILGYIQLRKGPNKLGVVGVIQPFSDAMKLFSKELILLIKVNYFFYLISPFFMLILILLYWMSIPYFTNLISFDLGMMYFFCCVSLSVYMIFISGWSSNSIYSTLGGVRAIAQTVSYEVSFILITLSLIMMMMSFSLIMFYFNQLNIWFVYLFFPIFLMFFISLLAEMNRTPFDFVESESELVSGFNVEYMSGLFAFLFMSEYSSMLFLGMIFSLMFFGGNLFYLSFYVKILLILFIMLWIRGTFPRFRYDKLMYLSWKIFLPISLNYLVYIMGLIYFFMLYLY
uniref:NADH-ubiquinone oxidoreductase chain 1 n=1 Tax=Xiphydria sp. ZJUH 2008002 TaxID=2488325 RepID=A0A3G5BC87_9HYME|nr:NADH dehydrogenase subunit 1 [Euxiphydria potanini]AYV97255.1 NADH deshydrogenase subunit 1 [Xiphydria sp. ZJUH 2008002]UYW35407.1 NADH dehydrogenase subunit 1 [Euxiphydria potanini]